MQGTLSGASKKGRPHTTWLDNIKEWSGGDIAEHTGRQKSVDGSRSLCGQPSRG